MKTIKLTMASLSILASMFLLYYFAVKFESLDHLQMLITFMMSMTTGFIGTYLLKTE